MDPDKDNANPTILNPSDLPSRRQADVSVARPDGSTGLFDDLILPSAYFHDPLESSASSDDDSEDLQEIDEQEIYGMGAGLYQRHRLD